MLDAPRGTHIQKVTPDQPRRVEWLIDPVEATNGHCGQLQNGHHRSMRQPQPMRIRSVIGNETNTTTSPLLHPLMKQNPLTFSSSYSNWPINGDNYCHKLGVCDPRSVTAPPGGIQLS
ncbi:hypothetical protein AVEN_18990-1 [Araneus ventricosus]|uniref:Uncharacterized protein n=1 Tax=Araneus ventricosus TaxID=182803 RepID=A0A4Y2DE23_ARAVE|nr:hypothetical protein AVEN_248185-1 [Araneus ventricosus]GBL86867.1 hypothetical protein AVEN_154152-1 [Araneus ventricosus]GBM14455.1 hypothetical protein AVEN_253436-1 [Araneus ventricosus]GBM14469.1 hypothetical protein AVEN_18990-1 [Araneus ventricosus]